MSAAARLVRQRLFNQQLVESSCQSPLDVVRRLGAVQAQDYAAAKWALAIRARGLREADIDAAIDAGAIVRTHVLRPTWHFVAPDDLRWMLALTAPRIRAAMATYFRKFDLDSAVLAKSRRAIARALAGRRYLTRRELADVLRSKRIVTDGLRRVFMMIDAEIEGIICSGPRRGNTLTYALADDRLPSGRAFSRDQALGELACRYFTSHGPAMLIDFAWWSGLSARDARSAIEAVVPPLEKETIDQRTYWFADGRPSQPRRAATVHLLPAFDEYLVAYQNRDVIVDGIMSRLPLSRADLLSNRVIVDGFAAGAWKRTIGSAGVTLEITLAESVGRQVKQALRVEAERYGAFLEKPAECRIA